MSPFSNLDYVLLEEVGGDHVPRKAATIYTHLSWIPAVCTCLLFLLLSICFGTPSTLFLYLGFLIIYSIAGLISLVEKLFAHHQQKHPFTPMMGVAFALLLLPLCIPIIPSSPTITPTLMSLRSPERVLFVAANLYNSEVILPSFISSLFDLASSVGDDKIFISIYESNSQDGTKTILSEFDAELSRRNIPHHIEMASTNNHVGVKGEFDRIRFLAQVRNKVYDALEVEPGKIYKSRINRVLWLNDIIFDSNAALRLLNTNGGDYDVACALDFVPLGLYDTWVTRDMNLFRAKPLWPYFKDEDDIQRLRKGQPIRVKSCWNGMAAFNADLLLDGRPIPFKPKVEPSSSSSNDTISWPLRFRESGPCLTSECLSINYDLHKMLSNDREPQIFINPTVRVAYNKATYYLYNQLQNWHIVAPWHLVWEDWFANRLFGFITDWGRKQAHCNDVLRAGFLSSPSSNHQQQATVL